MSPTRFDICLLRMSPVRREVCGEIEAVRAVAGLSYAHRSLMHRGTVSNS
jgi:hypothetical protein